MSLSDRDRHTRAGNWIHRYWLHSESERTIEGSVRWLAQSCSQASRRGCFSGQTFALVRADLGIPVHVCSRRSWVVRCSDRSRVCLRHQDSRQGNRVQVRPQPPPLSCQANTATQTRTARFSTGRPNGASAARSPAIQSLEAVRYSNECENLTALARRGRMAEACLSRWATSRSVVRMPLAVRLSWF